MISESAKKKFQLTAGNFVVAAIVVACAVYFFGGHLWRDLSIALHQQTTQGTITGQNRGALIYRYNVNGQEYSGTGVGDFDRPYPKGTALSVRYSSAHPSFSTIDESFLFEKQLACGIAIFGGIFLIVYLSRRKRRVG